MGLRKRQCDRQLVALFTPKEVTTALYAMYPERFGSVVVDGSDQANLWFSFVDDGLKVEQY